MNNKGFTLIELLMVIVLLSIITIIAIPIVGNALNISKERNYKILISNIKTAAKSYYEECSYNNESLGDSNCNINNKSMEFNLNKLVDLGYLSGNNECNTDDNVCSKNIKSPKGEQEDIGTCEIKITETTNNNGKVNYSIISKSTDSKCPTTADFEGED